MKAENYQACEFRAATNAGPLRVEGHFLIHDGLAVVLHKGYKAEKQSAFLYASEYATGLEIACAKRSEMLAFLSERIAYHGGAKKYLEVLRQVLRESNERTSTFKGVDTFNSCLCPSGYLLS